jgi:hypothetical protein
VVLNPIVHLYNIKYIKYIICYPWVNVRTQKLAN